MWLVEAVALLVEEKGKILLICEDGDREAIGKYAGMLSIPMGHLHEGEDPTMAALREFKEETGLEAEIDYPLGFFQIEMAKRNRAAVWAYKGHLIGSRKTTPLGRWMSEEEFLALDPFTLRPLNHELFQVYALARRLEVEVGRETVADIILAAMPKATFAVRKALSL